MAVQNEDIPFIQTLQASIINMFDDGFQLSEKQRVGIVTTSLQPMIFSRGWASIEHSETSDIVIAASYERPKLLPENYNPMYGFSDVNFISPVFQGLYERDYLNNFEWSPLIASSMPVLSNYNTTITVTLNENVKFADGVQLTAYDVVESYRMLFTSDQEHGWSYTDLIEETNSIIQIDEFTVQFNLNYPTSTYMDLLKLPIVPIHTWGNHTTVANGWDIEATLLYDLYKNGSSDYGFGSGPFVMSGSNGYPLNQNITFSANKNYWDGDVKLDSIRVENYIGYEEKGIGDIINNVIQIGLLKVIEGSSIAQLDAEDIEYTKVHYGFHKIMLINHYHPILGTGVDTPLGKSNPEKASLAARYVRNAINYAIPRDLYASHYWDSLYFDGNSEDATNIMEFNTSSMVEYNLTLAREYMEMAGYKFPELNTTDSTNPTGPPPSLTSPTCFFSTPGWSVAKVTSVAIPT